MTSLQIVILFFVIVLGLFLTFQSIKPLMGISLGIDYAQTMGVALSRLKTLITIASSLLSASVYCFFGSYLIHRSHCSSLFKNDLEPLPTLAPVDSQYTSKHYRHGIFLCSVRKLTTSPKYYYFPSGHPHNFYNALEKK